MTIKVLKLTDHYGILQKFTQQGSCEKKIGDLSKKLVQ
ncbi:hypothetical protein ETSB_0417 [cyanobacterium endosymbiont of Epithemia turgida isolate EtSB Lake Yunoko]|nr:hypothetical protein ETSB_0417 [cyanobacterium endosymbiont of Epithemia turgida isolate EtSB Lake Yunoko]